MKQVSQNEMDVLLRKLGTADHATATEVQSSHLDPDELSAYAENVLPPAARAKYTEHLIDCATCRQIVADLVPTTVLVTKKEEEKTSGIGEFLSKLITPSFLRYAVPSLAAVLILAVGFFVFNRQSEMRQATEMVAQNESQPTAAAPKSQEQARTASSNEGVNKQQSASPAEKAPAKTTTAVSQPESTPASAAVDEVRAQEELQKRAEVARADAARQAAAEPPPAPKVASPTEASAEREVAKSETMSESKKEPVADSRPAKEEVRKLDDYDAAANAPKSQPAPQTRRARGAAPAGMAAGAGSRDNQSKDKESDESSETRRVAGRNFRKVNGVWTDTAYDGRETTNLSRGSEQFRALIADEPNLRTIAEQLDGQVVVVWKGRAYRIR